MRQVVMRRIRRLLAVVVIPAVVTGVMAVGAVSAPALAGTGPRPLHLTALQLQFLPGTCLNPSCTLVQVPVVGKATSNLSTGAGSFQADLTVAAVRRP